ncbi:MULTISPECIES: YciI family protein [Kaistia]|uniref:YciI family protein n=1 Tax=Kaistia nematophila TaxID=2994654 RepID=A0A9X3E7F4_9HYPH|nr:YciI family protein [Kaistia nematophila]MCX5572152.1 YciI family protein [Kaistia nematophila]
MQYALLFYETEAQFTTRDHGPETQAYWGAWKTYVDEISAAGIVRGGEGLLGPQTATSLRIRGGSSQIQDGPFADTKEQLAGFFVIEVADIDAALGWATKAPCAPYGGVEVRPTLPRM